MILENDKFMFGCNEGHPDYTKRLWRTRASDHDIVVNLKGLYIADYPLFFTFNSFFSSLLEYYCLDCIYFKSEANYILWKLKYGL